MNSTTYSPEAVRALKALFKGVSGTKVSRKRVLENVSLKTYYNYGPTVYDAGLAEAVKHGNKLDYIKLTPAGREVLDNIRAKAQPEETTMLAMKQEYLLDDITRLVDKFNNLSGAWEWKLVRKETANHR
jgi:hypothetical protein